MQELPPKFESWCIVEVLGHNRFAGFVTEQAIGGSALIRVDIPAIPERVEKKTRHVYDYNEPSKTVSYEVKIPGADAYTKFFGVGSIYCITPCTEETARKAADEIRPKEHIPLDLAGKVTAELPSGHADSDLDPEDEEEFDGYPRARDGSLDR